MKLLFIDESKKESSKLNRYFFCQVGLMVDKEKLLLIEKGIEKIKEKYEIVSLKHIRGNISREKRLLITTELSDLLKKHDAKVLSTILGNVAMKQINHISDSYYEALNFLIERFFINLNKEKKTGLIIHDIIDNNIECKLRTKIHKLLAKENFKLGKIDEPFINRIYPIITFAQDDHSNILQASDLIATSLQYSVRKACPNLKKLKFKVSELPKTNDYLAKYWDLFVKDKNGSVDGLGLKVWW